MDRDPPTSGSKLAPVSHRPAGEVAKGSVMLAHAVGMHARPAVKLTKLAKRFRARIAVRVAGAADWIDAKSVAKVMAMRAARDSIIEFEASGDDAQAAVDALVLLIAQDFPDAGR
jgi:phosphocarrier protein HPr